MKLWELAILLFFGLLVVIIVKIMFVVRAVWFSIEKTKLVF